MKIDTSAPSNIPTQQPTEQPTAQPSEEPTPLPTPAPTLFSCDNTRECRAWNDPHFRTWDGLGYDFHGSGYYYYVAPCNLNDFRYVL